MRAQAKQEARPWCCGGQPGCVSVCVRVSLGTHRGTGRAITLSLPILSEPLPEGWPSCSRDTVCDSTRTATALSAPHVSKQNPAKAGGRAMAAAAVLQQGRCAKLDKLIWQSNRQLNKQKQKQTFPFCRA
jgi:hypothetical protein